MRVFLTGATGFIGSHIVPELLEAGYRVVGLRRSSAGADALVRAGAEVLRGDVNDHDRMRVATGAVDAVIHAAFHHDFSDLGRSSERDREVIETFGDALAGSDRPLIVSSGTGLAVSKSGVPVTETDGHISSADFPRAATEEAVDRLLADGRRVMVVLMPQVHDRRRQGAITYFIRTAREAGRVVYVGEGANRWPAAHVTDVARLYRLVLGSGRPGARYHAVDEEGVPFRDIAEAIGDRLGLPVESITPDEAPGYFGWMAKLAATDMSASSAMTRRKLEWMPAGPDLLTDLRDLEDDET